MKSVAASVAVLRNSSRSRSWVMDCSLFALSKSVVYLISVRRAGCVHDASTHPAGLERFTVLFCSLVDDGPSEAASLFLFRRRLVDDQSIGFELSFSE